jgi:outer membrane protein, heavy metal efflux system
MRALAVSRLQEIRMSADHPGPRPCVARRAFVRTRTSLLVLATLLAVPTGHAGAQPALTEREAVRLALARPAYQAMQAGRIGVAESIVAQAALPPNPTLGASHERTAVTGGSGSESTLQVHQSFDIAGRRALRREAAEQRLDAARSDTQAARARLVADVRNAFAESLYRERLRSGLAVWTQRIDAALKVVSQLVKGGEASGYERRRLERERLAAQARGARVAAEYRRSQEILLGLVGGGAGVTPAGDLIPSDTPQLASVQTALRARPELRSLAAQAEAFERERRAAERAWIPDVTVGAGAKRIDEPGRSDNGLLLSVSIPLALFDRGQAARARATAEAVTIRAEQTLKYERWEAELRGTWALADELRRAALSFRKETTTSSRELARIAEAAYRGGEATLLELLDAYRNELEAETTALELELAARQARIELDLLTGMVTYE